MSRRQTAADYAGKEISPDNAEDAPDDSPNQAAQADAVQSPFEQNNKGARGGANCSVQIGAQAKRLDPVASKRNDNNKKKTNE
ncbi:MAG: hypothetical protein JOY93_06760 [Acidobacteriales bacterium]|nr:hypothetical protein [Terriglobales bacterium]